MDPRKTVVIADFEEVMKGVKRAQEERVLREERLGAKTLAWSDPADATTSAEPAVVVSRTLIAGGEPRNLALAKTQVWRSETTVESQSGPRERARVHVDESVMQHLSAEVWAGQAGSGRMMLATVRRSVVDLQVEQVEAPRSEPLIASTAVIATRPTPISTEVYDPPRIPRRFQLPSARAIRITCAVVCAACVALLGVSAMRGGSSPGTQTANAAKPAADPPAKPAAAIRPTTPAAAPANDTPPAPSVGSASQREAVDALIAGKHALALARYRALARQHPDQPAYQAAARILQEAQQRNAE
jgi:hypothetical protein